MTAATNLVPMLAGPLVLGEALPASPLLLTLRLTAFAATGAGATLLARVRAHGSGAPAAGPRALNRPVRVRRCTAHPGSRRGGQPSGVTEGEAERVPQPGSPAARGVPAGCDPAVSGGGQVA